MSRKLEIPSEWFIKLLEQAKDTIKFHDGVLQEVDPGKAAALLGYMQSIDYLIPDIKAEDKRMRRNHE